MVRNLPTFRKVGMLLFPMLIILLAFLYYFFIYIGKNEKMIAERSYRILENVNTTFNNKIDFYKERLRNDIKRKFKQNHLDAFGKVVFDSIRVDSISIGFQKMENPEMKRYIDTTYRYSFEDLFKDISDYHYFEGVILIESATVGKDTLNRVLYSTSQKTDFLAGQLQKVLSRPEDNISTVKLEGENYKLFLHSVRILSEQNSNIRYLIGGMMKEDRFVSKKRSVPSSFLLFFSILFVLLIFSYPFLKLLFIGPLERISIVDVLLLSMSIVIGTSLITISFWEVYRYYFKNQYKQEEALVDINRLIRKEFVEEVKLAVKELNRHKSSPEFGLITKYCEVFGEGQNDERHEAIKQVGKRINSNGQLYYQYVRITGDDSLGNEIFVYGNKNRKKELFVVKKRNYFNDIVNQKFWGFKNDRDTILNKYSIESIQSYMDRSRFMIVSIPGTSCVKVLTLSTKPYSLTNTILPDNIEFCIIDDKGKVVFDNDSIKNLQENFLEECNYDPAITSAMFSRTSRIAQINYLEEKYTAAIYPIDQWPLFLVTLQNSRYDRMLSIDSVTLCLKFAFAKFLLETFLIFIQSIQFHKKKKLKFNGLQFEWIRPVPENKSLYQKALLFLFWSLLVMAVFSGIYKDSETMAPFIGLFFVIPLHIFLGIYVFLNDITWKNLRSSKFEAFLIPILLFLILYSIVSFTYSNREQNLLFLLFQFLMIAPLVVATHPILSRKLRDKIRTRALFNSTSSYTRAYKWLIFFWIGIAVIIPHFLLYCYTRNFEEELAEKYDLLNIAKKVVMKNNISGKESIRDHFGFLNTKGIYNINASFIEPQFGRKVKNEITPINKLLAELRMNYDTLLTRQNGLMENSSDSTWIWKGKSKMQFNPRLTSASYPDHVIQVSKIHYPQSFHLIEFVFFIAVFIFLLLLFQIINFYIQKVFTPKLFRDRINCTGYEAAVKELLEEHKCLFIVDIFNIKRAFVFDVDKVCYLNKYKITNEDKLDDKVLSALLEEEHTFVYHLDFNIHDKIKNKAKVLMIRKLVDEGKKLMIVSPLHPIQLLRSYNKPNYSDTENDMIAEQSVLCEQWSTLLKHFYVIYNHRNEYLAELGINTRKLEKTQDRHLLKILEDYEKNLKSNGYEKEVFNKKENLSELCKIITSTIEKECKHSEYLQDLADPVYKYATDVLRKYLEKKEYYISYYQRESHLEEIIVKIQNMAQVYYAALWSNCSSEEKLILYDLAEDELVNSKNVYTIQNLLSKGLIIEENGLEVMNSSFRNYILTIIEPSEALLMEKEISRRSTWPVINALILIVLLALGVFLLMIQEDMNKTITIITGFITSVPLIVKLFAAISEARTKTGKG